MRASTPGTAHADLANEAVPAAVVTSGVAVGAIVDGLTSHLRGVGVAAHDFVAVGDLAPHAVEECDRESVDARDRGNRVAEHATDRARIRELIQSARHFVDDLAVALVLFVLGIERRLGLGGRRDDKRRFGFGGRLVRHDDKAPRLFDRRRSRRDRRERVAPDRRGDELAGKVERFARAHGDLVAADQRAEEHSDGAVLRDETREEEPWGRTNPLGLVRHRPVEEDRAVRGERVIGKLKRQKTSVVEPGHPSDLRLDRVADGGLPHDRSADEVRNAVQEDAQGRFHWRRQSDDVQGRGVYPRRLHALGLGSHDLFASSRVRA